MSCGLKLLPINEETRENLRRLRFPIIEVARIFAIEMQRRRVSFDVRLSRLIAKLQSSKFGPECHSELVFVLSQPSGSVALLLDQGRAKFRAAVAAELAGVHWAQLERLAWKGVLHFLGSEIF